MKKIVTLCAVVIGFMTMTAMQPVAQAEFKFIAEAHNFGKIPQGKPVSYAFTFTNIGDQPLIITAVEPACGCTAANYTKTPVKKGERGIITLTYNAAASGAFTKLATVRSNANTPVKVLSFKGEVVAATTSM